MPLPLLGHELAPQLSRLPLPSCAQHWSPVAKLQSEVPEVARAYEYRSGGGVAANAPGARGVAQSAASARSQAAPPPAFSFAECSRQSRTGGVQRADAHSIGKQRAVGFPPLVPFYERSRAARLRRPSLRVHRVTRQRLPPRLCISCCTAWRQGGHVCRGQSQQGLAYRACACGKRILGWDSYGNLTKSNLYLVCGTTRHSQ